MITSGVNAYLHVERRGGEVQYCIFQAKGGLELNSGLSSTKNTYGKYQSLGGEGLHTRNSPAVCVSVYNPAVCFSIYKPVEYKFRHSPSKKKILKNYETTRHESAVNAVVSNTHESYFLFFFSFLGVFPKHSIRSHPLT